MMQRPRFSVVIPTYNQAGYLAVALRSVLDQTFQNFEIVVVNNYSSDDTGGMLERFGKEDERVRSIDFKNDGVIGASRNVGIRAARGEYVAFLDSDDVWYARKLERVHDVLRRHPNVRIVCHDEDVLRGGRTTGRLRYGPSSQSDLHDYLLFVKNCLSTSATVVEKTALDQVGGFSEEPEMVTVEDYDLWLRLAPLAPAYFLHEPLGQFRVHAASSSARLERRWRNSLHLLRTHLAPFEESEHGGTRRRARRRYASVWFVAARDYAGDGELKRGLGYFFKALAASPRHWRLYPGLALVVLDWLRALGSRSS